MTTPKFPAFGWWWCRFPDGTLLVANLQLSGLKAPFWVVTMEYGVEHHLELGAFKGCRWQPVAEPKEELWQKP